MPGLSSLDLAPMFSASPSGRVQRAGGALSYSPPTGCPTAVGSGHCEHLRSMENTALSQRHGAKVWRLQRLRAATPDTPCTPGKVSGTHCTLRLPAA